jgi:hypothetical protein
VVERGADDGVNLDDRLGCAAGAVSTAGGGEGVVQVVEVIGAQPTQRDVTDGRVDVAVDEPGVPVRSGGADLATLVRDPRVGEELAKRHRTGRCRRFGVAFAVEPGGELFGFVTVVADGMPSSAFPSGEWVEGRRRRRRRSGPCVARCSSSTAIDHFDTNPKLTIGCGRSSVGAAGWCQGSRSVPKSGCRCSW